MIPLLFALTPLEAIQGDDGWTEVGREVWEGAEILARHQVVGETDCLEAVALTDRPLDLMKQVVLDVPGNVDWSSADLLMSEVLGSDKTGFDYVQVLNLPTPLSDRYWYLRGTIHQREGWTMQWERVDGAARYPSRHAALLEAHPDVVEVTENVGSWTFTPMDGQTRARFRTCNDSGGSVPRWAGEKAARMMLPNNIIDLFKEVDRRAG